MMKLFIDTEFSDLENPVLISVGIVSERGDEFYREVEPDLRTAPSEWVIQNVLPHLSGNTFRCNAPQLCLDLRDWLEQFGYARIVSDAPRFDFSLVRDLFQQAGQAWPVRLATQAVLFTPTEEAIQRYFKEHSQAIRHHALDDARALCWCYSNRIVSRPAFDMEVAAEADGRHTYKISGGGQP